MTRAQRITCDRFWLHAGIGNHVIWKNDPRHVGKIARIAWSATARVHWDNGWMSDDVPLTDLWPARAQEWIA